MRPLIAFLVVGVFVTVNMTGGSLAHGQELDYSSMLQPLEEIPAVTELTQPDPKGFQDTSSSVDEPGKRTLLTGQVQTLQEAMESEKDTVNWYGWYMACREYLARTGGLQCDLGTPIKFHRDGRIEALTMEPRCLSSSSWRRFALPRQTKLDAIILPVRQGNAPPATPAEILSRIQAYEQEKLGQRHQR